MSLDIVIFGLSLSSSWGNGHATTYRALVKALHARGHRVTFLERDVPWYGDHRDLPDPPYCRLELYSDLKEVPLRYAKLVAEADLLIVGSYVPNGAVLADWATMRANGVTAFYDIDTPITLAMLAAGTAEYITSSLIPRFDLYLSFTGGPALETIETQYGSPRARALYCSVDPDFHKPVVAPLKWQLGYVGTYCEDRHQRVERLLIEPARRIPAERFVVAGSRYPHDIAWPVNVERIEHLPPDAHSSFYCSQKYTLNLTRADMIAAGYSPSVRLFEAAACGVPIISDRWAGVETVLQPGREILLVDNLGEVLSILREFPEERRLALAAAARSRILAGHRAEQRARQLERYVEEALRAKRKPTPVRSRRAALDAPAHMSQESASRLN